MYIQISTGMQEGDQDQASESGGEIQKGTSTQKENACRAEVGGCNSRG